MDAPATPRQGQTRSLEVAKPARTRLLTVRPRRQEFSKPRPKEDLGCSEEKFRTGPFARCIRAMRPPPRRIMSQELLENLVSRKGREATTLLRDRGSPPEDHPGRAPQCRARRKGSA
jgi:hypothetical protein